MAAPPGSALVLPHRWRTPWDSPVDARKTPAPLRQRTGAQVAKSEKSRVGSACSSVHSAGINELTTCTEDNCGPSVYQDQYVRLPERCSHYLKK